MDGYHKSVLKDEVLSALNVVKDKWYLDATLGDGGYTVEILKRGGKVLGVDVDPDALLRTKKRLQDLEVEESRFKLIQGNFRDIKNLIQNTQMDTVEIKFAGAIFDLGVSTLQFETPQRGFSFGKLGPLDMRMDPNLAIRAVDLVNNLSRKELYEIFKTLGEEKYSWDLAGALERTRQIKPFETTLELAEVASKVIKGGKSKIHPATRIFQSLRMVVNDELGAIKEGLYEVKELILKNGCIIVISFHSLEDRIAKSTFLDWEGKGVGEVLTKKPIIPKEQEILKNPRSRSSKLRIFKII